ncbi:MAG: biotin--[acetyl-CoA-carboxylase] ligase [Bacteroidetes bacterium GWF2_43_63]|nr:MAG: biotin--[acetyl-CoA-carboxylase] ligase [Bacteroidetes bacterium GWE2_42_42]OFY52628.1 MAG: biotin--[acetyl-CoA-carboxylase] ligase [Bacteroidetes bacterium GWF2_43_63]HBG69902.1 biotin--[acetyl-CoA-carboxylase] ligase [Bacteroidales bacterium]HCB62672.1 biotin--[acetyl-CoA-carboxylase] ligase [Bacteroidales bacterium]HCY23792.1 biotin--[acetyl-CoA-carboxylase] ligase [Bacteroidales bacterium]
MDTSHQKIIIMKTIFHRNEVVESTNQWAMSHINEVLNNELHIFSAAFQSAGRGQGDHTWESESGENILMSLLMKNPPVKVADQFSLSQVIAVAAHNYVSAELPGQEISIKWPNDIMVDSRKIAGILIENSLKGNDILATVIGIGVNVNQIHFSGDLQAAVSLEMIDGKKRDIETEINKLTGAFLTSYENFLALGAEKTYWSYDGRLFGIGTEQNFKLGNDILKCTILGSEHNGQMRLKMPDGNEKKFYHHEIAMCYREDLLI